MHTQLKKRIEAGKRAVMAQTGLMHRGFRRAKSTWKSDGTRVTAADLAISAAILRDLAENEAWPYFDTFNLHHYAPCRRAGQIIWLR